MLGIMKRQVIVFSVAAITLYWIGCAAQAPTGVHRCLGSAGEPVFSDRSCAGLALPDPAREVAPAAPFEHGICATSPELLRDRVARAFRQQDAIALSGLFLWQGPGTASAASALRDLAVRVREPLLELRIESSLLAWPQADLHDDIDTEPAAPRRSSRVDTPLELLVATSSGARNADTDTLRIALVNRSGCWWLERP
jgi:hypothetical protein